VSSKPFTTRIASIVKSLLRSPTSEAKCARVSVELSTLG